MATNSTINIGTRRFIYSGINEYRNFEPSGTVQYTALQEGFKLDGTTYHSGDDIAFDVGGTSYSARMIQILQLLWDQGMIRPKT